MKIKMTLEDLENGRPRFDVETEGTDPDQQSMSYSIYVLLRMVLELLNTEHRPQLVSLIGTLHREHREGNIEQVEVENVPTAPRHLH